MCTTLGTFDSLTNILALRHSDTGLVTMIQENSLSVLAVVRSGPVGLTQLFTFKRLLPQASILQGAAFTQ